MCVPTTSSKNHNSWRFYLHKYIVPLGEKEYSIILYTLFYIYMMDKNAKVKYLINK